MRHNLRQATVGAPIMIFIVVLLSMIGYFVGLAPVVIVKSAGLLIAMALLILFINISASRQVQPEIQQIVSGDYWTHWQVPLTVWEHEGPVTWGGIPIRMHPKSLGSLVQMALLAVLLAGGLGYMLGMTGGTPSQALQVAVISAVVLGLSVTAALYDDYRQTNERPSLEVVDLFLGSHGLYTTYLPERLLRVSGPGVSLVNILVIPGQPYRLQFELGLTHTPRQTYTASVPVPVGCETEAEDIAARFRETYSRSA